MDNEVSTAYIQTITDNWKHKYQLVTPNMHCRNDSKREIQTMKAHFLAILAGINPGFPQSQWDLLLPQAKININLLR